MKNKNIYFVTTIYSLALTICLFFLYNFSKSNLINFNQLPVKFGATYMTMNNPFFNVINSQINSTVEANGDILITLDAQLSIENQIEQVEYLIDEGVKVIFINPVDYVKIIPTLKKAKEAGIYIIAVDTNIVDDNNIVDASIISDNILAGKLCAEDMMTNLEKARILILTHNTAVSAKERIEGFINTLTNEYEVVGYYECEGQIEKAMPIVLKAIEDGIKFDVVMALNDPSALGALAAIQSKNIDNVLVYGVDGTPEAKKLVSDHLMQATVAQYPKVIGIKAISVAYDLLNGKSNYVDKLPVTLINKDNIELFNIDGWQ